MPRLNLTGKGRAMKVGRLAVSLISVAVLAAQLLTTATVSAEVVKTGTRGSDTTGAWAEFRGNLNNTGYSTSRAPDSGKGFFRFDATWPIRSSPVVHDDILYFGSEEGRLYAVDITSTKDLWNFSASGEFWASPLVAGGRVYIGSTNANFYAVNLTTHTPDWTFPTGATIVSSAKYVDGAVVFASQDGNMYFLNAETGQETIPAFHTAGEIWGTPAIVNGTAIIGSNTGNVSRVRIDNGAVVWTFTSGPTWSGQVKYTSAAVSGDRVFIASNDFNLYALDLETGDLVWKFWTGNFFYASPAVHGSVVFAHSTDNYLYALPFDDPTGDGNVTTEFIWRFFTADGVGGLREGGSSPAVAGGRVIVGSRAGKVYCVNENTGLEVWNFSIPGGTFSSPAVADGRVYIGGSDGVMYGVADRLPGMTVEILLHQAVIESQRSVQIVFNVTYLGQPVEGAFIKFSVTTGILSQSGASTLADGQQRVKYLSPKVTRNTTVWVNATAEKFGLDDAISSTQITVVPAKDYGTGSGTAFSLEKYSVLLAAIGVLAALNVSIYTIIVWRTKRGTKE